MDYYRLLEQIHALLQPRTYVEIGVRNGESLAAAGANTLSVGVDPDMEITFPQASRSKLFHVTSDEFFAAHDLTAELEGRPVDLAFIDGMHLFEFALRDFVNVERHCARGSTILVHDCLPIDAVTSSRERTTMIWSGDVWKLIVCLKRERPDLAITTLDVEPTGLGVIRNLDPSSTHLAGRLDVLYDEFIPLTYDDLLGEGKDAALNRAGHDTEVLERVLRPRRTDVARRLWARLSS